MNIYELPDIEFLDVYPSKTRKVKIPFKLLILSLNIILLFGGIVFSWSNIPSKTAAVPVKAPFLYEVINNTTSVNKQMVFKGEEENNYVLFNNMLWRILKVNSSGSITLILNDAINQTPWVINDKYNVMEYLNTKFLSLLDKEKLVSNKVCKDRITDLNNLTCNKVSDEYVTVLDVNSFIEAQEEGKSFLINGGKKMWLINAFDAENEWHSVGSKISYSKTSDIHEIKPVITLKNDVLFEKGNGTISDPYLIKSNTLTMGSTVKLGEDIYRVYDTSDNLIKLMLDKNLENKYEYQGDYEQILRDLETEFYENLAYKDLLEEVVWQKVNFVNNDISYEEIAAKVGIPNFMDFKVNNYIRDYYTLTNLDNYIMVYNNPIIYGTKSSSHYLRPVIAISRDTASKLKNIGGTFMMEAK